MIFFAVSCKMIQFHDHEKMDDAGDLYTCLGWAFAAEVWVSQLVTIVSRLKFFSLCRCCYVPKRTVCKGRII